MSKRGLQGYSDHGVGSSLAFSKMDNSFVVLPKQKSLAHGIPSCNHLGALSTELNLPSKAVEESFVVLPSAAASMYKYEPILEGGVIDLPPPGGNANNTFNKNNSGFCTTALQCAFDIATAHTQVDQPLCLECMRALSDKLDKEIEDVNRDIKEYEACLQHFEVTSYDVLTDAEFIQEKLKVEEEQRKLEASIVEAEGQWAMVNEELKELDSKTKCFKELEERYWHELNKFQFQLTAYQEERDAILTKIEVCQAQLELLKHTNVLNDAFPVSHDGEFGTINNFRLGRLPKIPVEWDEINAAWGQACLLLHIMAQYFRPKFQYRIKIIPMGSYPRIMDTSNNTYDLFGPVNVLWSTQYDKAMVLFLTCLKDFADFAKSLDEANDIHSDQRFRLPYKIENGRVENYTITQSFNKPENWTKALKYTLCDLKWAMFWFIGNTNFQPLSSTVSPHTDVSGTSSLISKHDSGTRNS